MKILKTAGAIYLGIYLILPGCLCQVLSVFGVSMHDHAIPQNVCVIMDADNTFPCHCDELDSKTGELTQNVTFGAIPESFVSKFLPTEAQVRLEQLNSRENIRSRAPPPPSPISVSRCRVFTGVYLV